MRVSILYFAGCPNHPPVVEMARNVIDDSGLEIELEEIDVQLSQVSSLRFLGSPSVHVDGVDIDQAARLRTDYAMACRVYPTPDGLPKREWLVDALGVPHGAGMARPASAEPRSAFAGTAAASVGSVLLSTACCWVPLLVLALGASAAGVAGFFERWRPALLALAVASLAIGFYLQYRRKTDCHGQCCSSATRTSRRVQRTALWVSAIVVGVFLVAPGAVTGLFRGSGPRAADRSLATHELAFHVDGMSCAACAGSLEELVAEIDGVVDVDVDYDTRSARVLTNSAELGPTIEAAAGQLGFTATPTAATGLPNRFLSTQVGIDQGP